MALNPFHLAFPVRDLEEARDFYVGRLGCGVGREAAGWIDFDFFGHQAVAHLAEDALSPPPSRRQCFFLIPAATPSNSKVSATLRSCLQLMRLES